MVTKRIKRKELRLSIGKKRSMFYCEIFGKTNVYFYVAISSAGKKRLIKDRKIYWLKILKSSLFWRVIAELLRSIS